MATTCISLRPASIYTLLPFTYFTWKSVLMGAAADAPAEGAPGASPPGCCATPASVPARNMETIRRRIPLSSAAVFMACVAVHAVVDIPVDAAMFAVGGTLGMAV